MIVSNRNTKQFALVGILLLLVAGMTFGQLSPRIANYDMSIELNGQTKEIIGSSTLFWKNPSPDTIRSLQFHLYLNAFKNSQSTWLKEAKGIENANLSYENEYDIWGYTDMHQVKDAAGRDLTQNMRYIQPDDDNEWDQTVVEIPLIEPVLPFDSIEIQYDFLSKLPLAMVRTGYSRDYHFAAQWFPKIGVYEAAGVRCQEEGQWNCHQYHRSAEYYADFGVYNVALTVPKEYVVGASGVLQKKSIQDSTVTYNYRAEDVIDFTWTACPDFIELTEDWKGVAVRMLVAPEHQYKTASIFRTLFFTMDYFEQKFEKYPYPSLTVVVTPLHGIRTSSMEYPTLFSVPAIANLPDGLYLSETLTVHEFIHQYFMQIIATNEQEEAWMDEGMTNFYEGKIMDALFGTQSSSVDIGGLRFGNLESNRFSYWGMDFPQIAPNSWVNWAFPEGTSHNIQYSKTTLWLKTMEGLVGTATFDKIMKTYYDRWKFKHPCGKDFTNIANEVILEDHGNRFGSSFDWFFDQVLYGTGDCDYEVGYIENKVVSAPIGIFNDPNEPIKSSDVIEKNQIASEVLVYRSGDIQLPVEILIVFEDGSQIMEQWDGKGRSVIYRYDKNIKYVLVDPLHKIYLDKNFINNRKSVEAETIGIRKYTNKFLFYLQNAMLTVASFC